MPKRFSDFVRKREAADVLEELKEPIQTFIRRPLVSAVRYAQGRFGKRPKRKMSLPRSLVPNVHYAKMITCHQTIALAPAVLGIDYPIKVNDTLDPTGSWGADQCHGITEMSDLYRDYLVFKGSVEVVFKNTTANPVWVLMWWNMSNTASTDVVAIREAQNSGVVGVLANATTDSGDLKRLRRTFNCRHILGSRLVQTDHGATGVGTVAPAVGIYVHVAIVSQAANVTGNVELKLTQYCKFSRPKFLS